MNTTKIAENTIVIDIQKSELESNGLNAKSLCYSKPKERQFIRQTIENAKKATGFDTNNCRILIELFPKISGSCKLVVTKLSNEKEYLYYIFENKTDLQKAITIFNLQNFELFTDEKRYIMKTTTDIIQLNEYATLNSNPDFELFLNEHFCKIEKCAD